MTATSLSLAGEPYEAIIKTCLAGYAKNTRESYEREIRRWLAWLTTGPTRPVELAAAVASHVEDWAYEPGRTASSVEVRLAAVSVFYERAIHDGQADINPVLAAHRPQQATGSTRPLLSRTEVELVLAAAAQAASQPGRRGSSGRITERAVRASLAGDTLDRMVRAIGRDRQNLRKRIQRLGWQVGLANLAPTDLRKVSKYAKWAAGERV